MSSSITTGKLLYLVNTDVTSGYKQILHNYYNKLSVEEQKERNKQKITLINYQKMLHTQIVLENMINYIREVIRVVSFKGNKYDLKCPGKSHIDKLI